MAARSDWDAWRIPPKARREDPVAGGDSVPDDDNDYDDGSESLGSRYEGDDLYAQGALEPKYPTVALPPQYPTRQPQAWHPPPPADRLGQLLERVRQRDGRARPSLHDVPARSVSPGRRPKVLIEGGGVFPPQPSPPRPSVVSAVPPPLHTYPAMPPARTQPLGLPLPSPTGRAASIPVQEVHHHHYHVNAPHVAPPPRRPAAAQVSEATSVGFTESCDITEDSTYTSYETLPPRHRRRRGEDAARGKRRSPVGRERHTHKQRRHGRVPLSRTEAYLADMLRQLGHGRGGGYEAERPASPGVHMGVQTPSHIGVHTATPVDMHVQAPRPSFAGPPMAVHSMPYAHPAASRPPAAHALSMPSMPPAESPVDHDADCSTCPRSDCVQQAAAMDHDPSLLLAASMGPPATPTACRRCGYHDMQSLASEAAPEPAKKSQMPQRRASGAEVRPAFDALVPRTMSRADDSAVGAGRDGAGGAGSAAPEALRSPHPRAKSQARLEDVSLPRGVGFVEEAPAALSSKPTAPPRTGQYMYDRMGNRIDPVPAQGQGQGLHWPTDSTSLPTFVGSEVGDREVYDKSSALVQGPAADAPRATASALSGLDVPRNAPSASGYPPRGAAEPGSPASKKNTAIAPQVPDEVTLSALSTAANTPGMYPSKPAPRVPERRAPSEAGSFPSMRSGAASPDKLDAWMEPEGRPPVAAAALNPASHVTASTERSEGDAQHDMRYQVPSLYFPDDA